LPTATDSDCYYHESRIRIIKMQYTVVASDLWSASKNYIFFIPFPSSSKQGRSYQWKLFRGSPSLFPFIHHDYQPINIGML